MRHLCGSIPPTALGITLSKGDADKQSTTVVSTRRATLDSSLPKRVELVRASYSPLQKKKKAQAGNEWSNILPKSSLATTIEKWSWGL